MTPKELALLLIEAAEAFAPILGNPSHDNPVHLHEDLMPTLLQSGYKNPMQSTTFGASLPLPPTISRRTNKPFPPPKRIGAYPTIPKEEKDQTQRLKAIWKMCLKDYALYSTGARGASALILAVIDTVWYRELFHPTTFYTAVFLHALLYHLEDRCTVLNAIDAVDLPLISQGYSAGVFKHVYVCRNA